MTNLRALQKFNIFKSFADGWQETLGSSLLLLSPAGELIASSVDVSRNNWKDLLKSTPFPAHTPAVFTHLDQTVLAAPLTQNSRPPGLGRGNDDDSSGR